MQDSGDRCYPTVGHPEGPHGSGCQGGIVGHNHKGDAILLIHVLEQP